MRFFFASVSLHLFLVIATIWFVRKMVTVPPAGPAIRVSVRPGSGGPGKGSGSGAGKSRRASPHAKVDFTIPPGALEELDSAREFQSESGGGGTGTGGKPGGGGIFKQQPDRLGTWVFGAVQGVLDYPEELVKIRAEGNVKMRLRFSSSGEPLWKSSPMEARSPWLRAHINQILREALPENVPQELILQGEQPVVVLEFSFHAIKPMRDVAERLWEESNNVIGRTLRFYRSGPKTAVEWSVGPFEGMLPLPAVGLNLKWFGDLAGDLIGNAQNKVKTDPLDKYRNDPAFRERTLQ